MRIAVVTPTVDRQHGTERVLAEQLQRLCDQHRFSIELYAQSVQGLRVDQAGISRAGEDSGGMVWHKVPSFPGPHLFGYVWWFLANSARRVLDHAWRERKVDITFSPGINGLGVDVIAVHIVFHAFYDQTIGQLRLLGVPLRYWPRRLHRRFYYRCIMTLENYFYRKKRVELLPVSDLVAQQLRNYFGRTDVRVIPNGVDIEQFNPVARASRRSEARASMELGSEDFVLLLIGNDWVKKGLFCLLHAVATCRNAKLRVLVVGNDDAEIFAGRISDLGLQREVRFAPVREDVLSYYAMADAYVGPSLEDAFGLPILEAMACGMPVIASKNAGASQAIRSGVNGLVLQDPEDSDELAAKIGLLAGDESLRRRLGEAAAETAKEYGWEQNVQRLRDALATSANAKVGHKK